MIQIYRLKSGQRRNGCRSEEGPQCSNVEIINHVFVVWSMLKFGYSYQITLYILDALTTPLKRIRRSLPNSPFQHKQSLPSKIYSYLRTKTKSNKFWGEGKDKWRIFQDYIGQLVFEEAQGKANLKIFYNLLQYKQSLLRHSKCIIRSNKLQTTACFSSTQMKEGRQILVICNVVGDDKLKIQSDIDIKDVAAKIINSLINKSSKYGVIITAPLTQYY